MSDAHALVAHEVSFSYGKHEVLHKVSLRVPKGGAVGLVGPSGQGKSTLGAIMAMLKAPSQGTVSINGVTATGIRTGLQPALRGKVGMVFQSPLQSVDPRMSIGAIVTQPLRAATPRVSKAQARVLAAEALEHVGLDPAMSTRSPNELSGGQLQRACIARVMLQQPDYIILDEATSMVDATTTASLVRTIQHMHHEHNIGILAISHDRPLLDVWVGADNVLALSDCMG